MNVFAILMESGIIASGQNLRETELFKRSLALGLIANGEKQNAKSQTSQAIPEDAQTVETLLQVSGMWCSSCAWLIEHALSKERGIVSAEAFFSADLVKVKYCPQYLPPARIAQRIEQLGYKACEFTGDNDAADAEKRDLLLRFGIAGFLWLNIMTLSTALYVGYFEKINDGVSRFLPFVLMTLAAPVILYSAKPILQLAYQGLVNRSVRMETLLGLGILAAYFYSVVQAFLGEKHIYFDTASAIVTLVLLGKLIERNAKERTARAITMLYRMMPKKVRLMVGDDERFVSIDALNVGDVFMVKAGERIPADGFIVAGNSYADESLLTGEALPVTKDVGSSVVSGSVNIGSVLQIRATKVGDDTTLAQIIRLVERALSSRSELERTVDKVSRVFVPSVIVIAFLTFAIALFGGFANTGDALMRAITVLVIACPCALGMATPLAITAAIGTASRQGILVSDSRVLETIRRVDAVIFDKTGTVTEGNFSLLDYAVEKNLAFADAPMIQTSKEFSRNFDGAQEFSKDFDCTIADKAAQEIFNKKYLPMLAALERYSEHPLGRAIMQSCQQQGIALPEAKEIAVHKGEGLTGIVANQSVFIGNRRFAEKNANHLEATFASRASDWEREGLTVAFFGWEAKVKGLLAFGDRVKPEAFAVVSELKRRGIKVTLLSGDAKATTAWVANQIGADDFLAEVLPAEKTAAIVALQQAGQVVAMVGDGVNDAPALAQADLGIALGSGTDIAMKAAAIVLMSNSLGKVLEAFLLANKTWRVVRQNLFWAFFYNTLGISLAVTGILNPILAAGAMLLSSLSVIGNSLRLSASLQKK
jgi:cation transport ATPase